jgi:hypothetical protein
VTEVFMCQRTLPIYTRGLGCFARVTCSYQLHVQLRLVIACSGLRGLWHMSRRVRVMVPFEFKHTRPAGSLREIPFIGGQFLTMPLPDRGGITPRLGQEVASPGGGRHFGQIEG